MTTAVPIEIRKLIIQACEKGLDTQKNIAEMFQVTPRTVLNFLKLARDGEDLGEKLRSGRPPAISEDSMDIVKNLILSNPDKTLKEYCELVEDELGIKIGKSIMGRVCQKLDLRRKKKSFYAAEQNRPDVKKKEKILLAQ